MTANFKERLEELQQLQHDVAAVKATARTRNGDVRVEIGPRGDLLDIRFNPQALKRMSARQLAHTIMTLVAEAKEDAAGQAEEMTAAFLPEEMADRLRAGEQDLMALLPEPPRIPQFGQV